MRPSEEGQIARSRDMNRSLDELEGELAEPHRKHVSWMWAGRLFSANSLAPLYAAAKCYSLGVLKAWSFAKPRRSTLV